MAKFDINRYSTQEKVLGGAALVALIALFLPWYGFSAGGFSASVSGWSTNYGWLGGLLLIAAGVYLVLVRSDVNVSNMPVTPLVIIMGVSMLGTLIVAIRWLTLPSGHGGGFGVSYSYGPMVGLYLTLIAGIVESVIAVMLFRASSEKLPWDKASTPPAPPAA